MLCSVYSFWVVARSNVALMHDSRPIRQRKLEDAMPQRAIVPQDDILFLIRMDKDVFRFNCRAHEFVHHLSHFREVINLITLTLASGLFLR